MPTFQKVKIRDMLEKISGQKKVPKGDYLSFGEYEIIDQGDGNIAGFCDNAELLYNGPMPAIVFGDHTCRLKLIKKPFCLGADGTQIMHTKKIDQAYFYYALKSLSFKISAYQRHYKLIKEKFILYPESREDQIGIASVLSAYDDLIENNEKRIKALEQMAQLLYTEWFVKFEFPASLCHPEPHHRRHSKPIPCHPEAPAEGSQGYKSSGGKMINTHTEYGKIPEGWEVKRLGDKLNISKGKNITKSTIVDGTVPVVAGGLSPAYFHNKANAYNPVVTISASGANSGFVNLYQEDIWASDCSYIDNNATPFVYFYYLFLKNKQIEITKLQRGSAQPHVYPKDLMQLLTLDIPEKLMNAFESKAKNNFDMIKNFKKKNQVLSQARDLLIPQLVTGKRELK